MLNSGERRFSGFGLYLLWTFLLILFSVLVRAIFNIRVEIDMGFPAWLVFGRLAVLTGLFVSIFGLLGLKKWSLAGFFGSAAVMIPMSVAYNAFLLQLSEEFILTTGWIIRNTVVMAVVVFVLIGLVLFAIRPSGKRIG